jgi:hypothetical protein
MSMSAGSTVCNLLLLFLSIETCHAFADVMEDFSSAETAALMLLHQLAQKRVRLSCFVSMIFSMLRRVHIRWTLLWDFAIKFSSGLIIFASVGNLFKCISSEASFKLHRKLSSLARKTAF